MPNPHFDVKVISRSNSQSVVAAAAYRSGETLYDSRSGKTIDDYSRREDVLHAEIMTPAGTPAWASNREILWNKVEAYEKRKDAQLARSIIAALPRELDKEQNIALVRDYIQVNFIDKGMIADFAIHESSAGDGNKNPHAHILLTLRPIEGDSFGKKNREWNQKNTLNGWRDAWEVQTNQHLARAGRTERVSLKSYKTQGVNKQPQIHLGPFADSLERKGVESRRGDRNRRIHHENVLVEILTPVDEAEFETAEGSLDGSLETSHRQPEKGQMRQAAAFLNADPTLQLEAMTLELKDDQEEFSEAKSGANSKEASLNAFKNEDNDPAKLAAASLAASGAIHEAAVREYLESPGFQKFREQMPEKIRLAEYARLTAEKFKAFVNRQLVNLRHESERSKPQERRDDLER